MIIEEDNKPAPPVDTSTVLVIGLGNSFRGDDGIGVMAAKEIAARNIPGVAVVEMESDGASLMKAWQGMDRVLLIDAVKTGLPPATICRIDVSRDKIPVTFFARSTHVFGAGHAIEMARELRQLPASLIVYGMEGERFEFNTTISPRIKENIHVLNAMIRAELNNWRV